MLAKMPEKTVKSPLRNKLTIISLVLLMGLGLSAAYFTVPYLQTPMPSPNSLIGNTTNNTVSSPVSHINSSSIKIQTPQENTTPTANTNTSTVSTPSTSKQVNNTGKQVNNTSKNTSNNSKTTTNSQTTHSSTNSKKTTNNTG